MQEISSPAPAPAWPLQDAKAQFSALVDSALRGVPQHVTRRGKRAVVVLSEEDFEALRRGTSSGSNMPETLIEHLLAIPKVPKAPKARDHSPGDASPRLDVEMRDFDFT